MSLRARILLLVLCATFAPALIRAYLLVQDRERAIDEAREKLQEVSQRIAGELQDAVHSTAQLEYGLSRARDLDTQDRAACSGFLAEVLREYPQYTGLLTIQPDGTLFCDSLRSGKTLLLSDRHYFQQALQPQTRLALEPTFGRLTGKAVLQIAYGARNELGAVKSVLLASLDLDKFMRGRAKGLPFESAVLVLMHKNGKVLTWLPEGENAPGKSIADSPLYRFAAAQAGTPQAAATGAGETARVWAATEVKEPPGADLYVLVGVSRSELTAAADRRLVQTLATVVVVSLLAFIIGWAMAEAGIQRPIKRMENATARIGSGDLRARIGEPYPGGELGDLMRALDSTAEQLERLNADLERRVAERTGELEAANKELESFSYSISHDLRTPLRAIEGFTSVLQREHAHALSEDGRRLLAVVRDRASKMSQLIDELLEFSRIGRSPLNAARIDMGNLARSAWDELGSAEQGTRPAIEFGPLPTAVGDPALLKQVWLNLLSNAIKFTRKGNDPRIRVSATGTAAEDVFTVTDNGAGFDMAFYEKLFGVFERLHSAEEFPGTGVGLAIVKRIVERHHGRVWAEGQVGEGASFHFSLPRH